MKKSALSILIMVVFLVPVCSGEVSTGAIDNVREKQVLSDRDFSVIDEFVNNAVDQFLQINNFSSVSRYRAVILSRKSNTQESSRQQYESQFYESAQQAIGDALEEAEKIEDPQRRFKVLVNLLVLADGLENPRVSQAAIDFLDSPKKSVRYWAVHCLTNPQVTEELNNNPSDYAGLGDTIISEFEKIVGDCGYETAVLITEFAANYNQGGELLIKIAKDRLEKYENWNVDNVYFDVELLEGLCKKIVQASGAERNRFARHFSQLYSYAIQRYIKGKDILTNQQKSKLASLIVEIERSCIGKRMQLPQVDIKKAVENNDYTKLWLEHNRLLGDDTKRGRIALAYDFDYGEKPDGTRRTAPLSLSEPK